MNVQTKETRQHILDTGYDLIVAKGFSNVGLSQLLKHAEVPKGSFYHYFKSKEQFGEALINGYFTNYLERLNALLCSNDGSAYDRLIGYWQRWIDVQEGVCGAQKCLVVKLTAEVSDLSDPMRLALLKGATSIISAISQCIEDGNKEGSVTVGNSQETAQLLYNLWIGASLMRKLTQNQASLELAMETTKKILAGEACC
ncbi:TetR/AcrR family transcriptional regulator [Photobacterium chitinilyticum]|uniref:TetR/AcrR family transcriptional regulator n=1 Tax=Photobacterium chitinilyticum TaxID=2485123 RepID=A0A3S3QQI4_9GAMM|nr:TetR/AcrR family transcriptional regulator [Photobacterium chitinilyticum]RWX56151.1 TetR/AcrR family transcriptional regulator [Photobacterium chitinilyticum]